MSSSPRHRKYGLSIVIKFLETFNYVRSDILHNTHITLWWEPDRIRNKPENVPYTFKTAINLLKQ